MHEIEASERVVEAFRAEGVPKAVVEVEEAMRRLDVRFGQARSWKTQSDHQLHRMIAKRIRNLQREDARAVKVVKLKESKSSVARDGSPGDRDARIERTYVTPDQIRRPICEGGWI